MTLGTALEWTGIGGDDRSGDCRALLVRRDDRDPVRDGGENTDVLSLSLM